MNYLDRLKRLNEKYLPIEASAKTAKIDLHGLCSSPIAQKSSITAEYLGGMKESTQVKTPIEGTAQTAKTNLRGFCRRPIGQKTLISSAVTSYRWRLHLPDGTQLEVCFSPPANHTDALDAFPGSVAAEPWPEHEKGTPGASGHAGNAKPGLALGDGPEI
ncbi:MAG: hypothetical protein V5B35_12695 [Candidatus Accumulibacter necessarius]|jgi:hypothetical protein